ncbi:trimeric intracellular cation channel family protein [uncultured Corynebacterium sp.]|uniref:trimeric intracellular cation channel family protein n=1 Tax=uncultured Corynebacterium sp. TaxID=159447 RepID=UPI0028897220|nr:trimeric intracellular cation channel family protein [uncultured Corynebacterium sp.]
MTRMYFDNVFTAVGFSFALMDLIGVFLNALMGGLVARRLRFDAVGFMLISIISGMAGGMIRDALIGATPASALQNPWYIGTALVGSLFAFLIPLSGLTWELFRFHGDMIIVGVWAVTGTVTAMRADITWFGCILMGVLTATGGMVIREMMIGQIPSILIDRQWYVVPAIVASISVQLFYDLNLQSIGLAVSALIGFGLGVAAYWFGWHVPGIEALANVDDFFTRIKHRVGGRLPRTPSALRQRAERAQRPGMLVHAPTRKDIHDILGNRIDDRRNVTHEEFLDALYRAYIDPTGPGGAGGSGSGVGGAGDRKK